MKGQTDDKHQSLSKLLEYLELITHFRHSAIIENILKQLETPDSMYKFCVSCTFPCLFHAYFETDILKNFMSPEPVV